MGNSVCGFGACVGGPYVGPRMDEPRASHAPQGRQGPASPDPAQPRLPMDENRAATVIQRFWKGARQRDALARELQNAPPHKSGFECSAASNSLSVHALQTRRPEKRYGEAEVYMHTKAMPDDGFAYLHSMRNPGQTDNFIQRIATHEPVPGEIYTPPGRHDMRMNSMWLLGLAHHRRPAVMTAPLDDRTIIRNSALHHTPDAPTDIHLSAYAREVVGLLNSGRYEVRNLVDPASGRPAGQSLEPNDRAATARLSDFRTPRTMPKQALRAFLQSHGVDVSRISSSGDAAAPAGSVASR